MIGSVVVDPPVLQAPMAGYTNYAFRQVVREFGGAGLLATEMIAARSAMWLETNRGEHPDRLWGVQDVENQQFSRYCKDFTSLLLER